MSYGVWVKSTLIALVLTGCAAKSSDADDSATSSAAELNEAATITFNADFTQAASGTLQKGKQVRVAYDVNRLTACRGDFNGQPGWSITGYWQIAGGTVHSFEAGGFSPSGGTQPPVFTLDASGDLQLWFQNNSRWGCNAYDSNFGNNYHFTVAGADTDPGWMGNVSYDTSRATCGAARPCDADIHPVSGDVVYDTWTRERAAIREIYFEVWKQGVTDFDNADLWKQLDVEVHSRVRGTTDFATAYVSFDSRLGNNARYGVDLRNFDPIPGPATLTNKADCPKGTLTKDATGMYVDATVEMYFTVNGVELRPAPGGVYTVRYEDYEGMYDVCLAP